MKKVSIIIPFFNAEKIIENCLEKILKQTYKNIDILLINDNSTDGSERKIEKYIDNEKIKYYKLTENTEGVSYARNYGIEKATGDYFIFVDVDDYISDELIEKLSCYMEKDIDVIKFKTKILDQKGNIIQEVKGPVFEEKTGDEAFNELCFKDKLIDVPWLYLMKKDYFVKENFEFTVNTYHEDFGLMPIVVAKADTVVSQDIYGYFYVQSDDSIIRTTDEKKNIKKAYDKLIHYDNMLNRINGLQDKTKEDLKIYYTNVIILTVNELNGEERKKFITQIKKRKMLKNIKVNSFKQLLKKVILNININWYLKLR